MAIIGKVDHISITVKDMQETETFYKNVLGFETVMKLENLDCPDYSDVMGVEGVILNAMIMSGHGIAIEFLEFKKASGEKLPFKIAPRRAGDLAELVANVAKANRELGWKTELTIEDAMRDTIKYLNNLAD